MKRAEQADVEATTAATGLPVLHRWRSVYFVVLGFLAASVVFLTLLPRLCS